MIRSFNTTSTPWTTTPFVQWIATTETAAWITQPAPTVTINTSASTCADYTLSTTGGTAQTLEGFGACFNELGSDAISALNSTARAALLAEFWHPTEGMGLVYNRVPVGGNDYSDGWYSYDMLNRDEMDSGKLDLELTRFSVARDETKLLPYILAAQKLMDLEPANTQHLFASAWSPPMWMKQNKNFSGCSTGTCSKVTTATSCPGCCNSGSPTIPGGPPSPPNNLIQTAEAQTAYAKYLSRFVTEYKHRGVAVTAMMVQNEPYAGGCNYPKCEWTGEMLRRFIRDFMGPTFKQEHSVTNIKNGSCEVWLGTLNTEDFLECPNTVLSDIEAKKFIKGAALQWAGKGMIERVSQTWPDLPLIQSENECGDGTNAYSYAMTIFDLMRHYIGNGVRGYTYWNPILGGVKGQHNGSSHWGWTQNSMVTVAEDGSGFVKNHEFYVFSHFARFFKPGAMRLEVAGDWSGTAIAARNPPAADGGSIAVVVMNPHLAARRFTFETAASAAAAAAAAGGVAEEEGEVGKIFTFTVQLAPQSFNSFLVQG